MDKCVLRQQVLERLAEDLLQAEQAVRAAHEAATHEEDIAENKSRPGRRALRGRFEISMRRSVRTDQHARADDRGYECLLVEDGTESYFPAFRQAAIEMIVAQGGIVGWCAPSRAVLQAL